MSEKPTIINQSVAGFTLIEMLVVIIMVGILAAIAGPSYLGFLNRQRLNVAQNQVLEIMRTAQTNAKREKTAWAACFRDDGNKVEWSVSRLPEGIDPLSCATAINWQPLSSDSKVIAIKTTETTFNANPATSYPVKFKYDGSVTPLGHITLVVRNQTNSIQRCVYTATILGALRAAKENSTPNPSGYYCY